MSTPSADRLNEINTELQGLLEARIAELTAVMKTAETTTRTIVSTEMEIARYRHVVETLGGEVEGLQKEAGGLRARVDEARAQYAELAAERDRLRSETGRLHDQEESLRRETSELRGQVKSLEEAVSRLRRLKDESLAAVSDLRGRLDGKN